MEDELIKILRDFETFKMSDEEKNVYAHTNSYKPFVERIKQVKNNVALGDVRLPLSDDAIHFAEWMDVVCIRDGRFDWKYIADNHTKKHTTKEMFTEWLKLTSNETQ